MAHIKYRAVVNVQFFGTIVNGIPLYRVTDKLLPYSFTNHDSIGCCHKSTPALLTEETLFAAFVPIADSLCTATIEAVRNTSGMVGCQKYFYCIKQCIDCISRKLLIHLVSSSSWVIVLILHFFRNHLI